VAQGEGPEYHKKNKTKRPPHCNKASVSIEPTSVKSAESMYQNPKVTSWILSHFTLWCRSITFIASPFLKVSLISERALSWFFSYLLGDSFAIERKERKEGRERGKGGRKEGKRCI
jgi:hypothetical protein